jgi:TPR repeat protein
MLARSVVLPGLLLVVGTSVGCCKDKAGEAAGECKLGAVDACSKGCDEGKQDQCMMLGRSYQMGEPKGDRDKAILTFKKSCKAGHGPACEALAYMVDNSYFEDTYKPGIAKGLLKQACDAGGEHACVMYYTREFKTDADKETAFKAFESGCKQGKLLLCTHLAWMHGSGHHAKEDSAKAAKMYEDNCAKSEPVACAKLSMAYRYGWGVDKNEAKANELGTKACEAGCAEACTDLATTTDIEYTKRSVDLKKRACSLYSDLGCALLASDYKSGIKNVLPEDPELALKHYNQACMLGLDSACKDGNVVLLETVKE